MNNARVTPRITSRELIATTKGLRPDPCLFFTCARARKECKANMLNRSANAAKCISQANPQSCFATFQFGPGSGCATAEGSESVTLVDGELDMARSKLDAGKYLMLAQLARPAEPTRL